MSIVSEFVGSVVSVITTFLSGIGSGIVGFFETLFIASEGGISTFGIWTAILLGLSFVTGLVAKLMGKF